MPVTVQQTTAARSCRRQERWQPGAPAAGAELLWLGTAQSLFQFRAPPGLPALPPLTNAEPRCSLCTALLMPPHNEQCLYVPAFLFLLLFPSPAWLGAVHWSQQ